MALPYGLSVNTSLVFSIQNQCTLANYVISVERLNQYMHIRSEAPEVIEGNLYAFFCFRFFPLRGVCVASVGFSWCYSVYCVRGTS